MLAVVQRVAHASVTIDSIKISKINEGLLILLGVGKGDQADCADELAEKITTLRLFEDNQNRMNHSLLETQGSALVVSQFTLLANTSRGRRPGFEEAAPPEVAEPLYERFVEKLRMMGIPTETGRFGASMQVQLQNDGPVTLILKSKNAAH